MNLAEKAMRDPYSPRRLHVSGLTINPYQYVIGPSGGIVYQNGQRYVASATDGQSAGDAPQVAIMNTPECGCCG